jgi:hypothetical protein
MSIKKELGKIKSVFVGHGGYQDVQLGITFIFEGEGFGIGDFRGFWDVSIESDKNTKWTEKDRDAAYAKTMRFISKVLTDAKVANVAELKNKPVEVTIEDMRLKSWRILTEVL